MSDIGRIDYFSGDFDLGPDVVGKLLDARIALMEAIMRVNDAEKLMPDEER